MMKKAKQSNVHLSPDPFINVPTSQSTFQTEVNKTASYFYSALWKEILSDLQSKLTEN